MEKANAEHLEGVLGEVYTEMVNKEWAAPFNSLLGLAPEETSCSSSRMAYWKCPHCGNVYRMPIKERLNRKFRNQESCYYCRGRRQKHPFTV